MMASCPRICITRSEFKTLPRASTSPKNSPKRLDGLRRFACAKRSLLSRRQDGCSGGLPYGLRCDGLSFPKSSSKSPTFKRSFFLSHVRRSVSTQSSPESEEAEEELRSRSGTSGNGNGSGKRRDDDVIEDEGKGGGKDEDGPLAVDVVALNNLCVDIILPVDKLPPLKKAERLIALEKLTSGPAPPVENWEVGGASNFAIAASRLGLQCLCLGHLGRDIYGDFMLQSIKMEGVHMMQVVDGSFPSSLSVPSSDSSSADSFSSSSWNYSSLDEGSFEDGEEMEEVDMEDGTHPLSKEDTLLCWVLVDPKHQHGFCSRFDFTTTPLLQKLPHLPPRAMGVIREAGALMVNGFVFDELSPEAVEGAVEAAKEADTAVFFDPGPRGGGLSRDVPAGGKHALEFLLRVSDVLLLTQEEGELVTGLQDPEEAAKCLLNAQGSQVKWVVLKVGSKGCFVITKDETIYHPAMKIKLEDTVGCGDSLAAAIVLGYCRGFDLMTTLSLANAVGGATACRRGAGRNVATADLVQQLLQTSIDDNDDFDLYRESASKVVQLLETLQTNKTSATSSI